MERKPLTQPLHCIVRKGVLPNEWLNRLSSCNACGSFLCPRFLLYFEAPNKYPPRSLQLFAVFPSGSLGSVFWRRLRPILYEICMLFVAGCFGVNIDTGTAETDKQSTISPQTVQREENWGRQGQVGTISATHQSF